MDKRYSYDGNCTQSCWITCSNLCTICSRTCLIFSTRSPAWSCTALSTGQPSIHGETMIFCNRSFCPIPLALGATRLKNSSKGIAAICCGLRTTAQSPRSPFHRRCKSCPDSGKCLARRLFRILRLRLCSSFLRRVLRECRSRSSSISREGIS